MRHPESEWSAKGRLVWIILALDKLTKAPTHNRVIAPWHLSIALSYVSLLARSPSPIPPPSNDNKTPTPQNQITELPESQQAVVQRSRWQAVLLEAGGIGAAVSEESMRRLKYCLQWLQVCLWFFLQISYACDFPISTPHCISIPRFSFSEILFRHYNHRILHPAPIPLSHPHTCGR